jgi:hypothetical protein
LYFRKSIPLYFECSEAKSYTRDRSTKLSKDNGMHFSSRIGHECAFTNGCDVLDCFYVTCGFGSSLQIYFLGACTACASTNSRVSI